MHCSAGWLISTWILLTKQSAALFLVANRDKGWVAPSILPKKTSLFGSEAISLFQYGGFLKWSPIAGWFISWKILLQWMIQGYPYFRKPSYCFLFLKDASHIQLPWHLDLLFRFRTFVLFNFLMRLGMVHSWLYLIACFCILRIQVPFVDKKSHLHTCCVYILYIYIYMHTILYTHTSIDTIVSAKNISSRYGMCPSINHGICL